MEPQELWGGYVPYRVPKAELAGQDGKEGGEGGGGDGEKEV